ncbi:MAG: hypothetical protein BAJALOKI1v1_520002 [Promethearchaeota archaeon]|nr:MAG: hypothetical protein BAJALOKI1v1_520002 [Candidatus Lokiarchaeota archaeon]
MVLRIIEDERIARIIAFLLTDGSTTKTHFNRPTSFRINFTSEEDYLLKVFQENMESYFGKLNWRSYKKRVL